MYCRENEGGRPVVKLYEQKREREHMSLKTEGPSQDVPAMNPPRTDSKIANVAC